MDQVVYQAQGCVTHSMPYRTSKCEITTKITLTQEDRYKIIGLLFNDSN